MHRSNVQVISIGSGADSPSDTGATRSFRRHEIVDLRQERLNKLKEAGESDSNDATDSNASTVVNSKPWKKSREGVVRSVATSFDDDTERNKSGVKDSTRPQMREKRVKSAMSMVQLLSDDDDYGSRRRSAAAIKRSREKERRKNSGLSANGTAEQVIREILIPDMIEVKELSNRMAVKSVSVIKSLMALGVKANINQSIDADTAELIVQEHGHIAKRVTGHALEKSLLGGGEVGELIERAPVVTIMGHVDHGKTTLLDTLRKSNVTASEQGGITQHIGAYQISINDKSITFIDTPGHAAFSEMRARGAKVTDIIILVVAADDGIKVQTEEAIKHAKSAGVPIIVAMNKIDKVDNEQDSLDRIKTSLLSHDIVAEDMGGDVMVVPISAMKSLNLDKLIDAILLNAELLELKASKTGSAKGVVLESRIDKGKGVVTTLLVQSGTLNKGDIVVAGKQHGKIRIMYDENGKKRKDAKPSVPVEIWGLEKAPNAGDDFLVVEKEKIAREIVSIRANSIIEPAVVGSPLSLDSLFEMKSAQKGKVCRLILKGDVHGSVEAIRNSITAINDDEVRVEIMNSGVGDVTESDITFAKTSGARIIAFNVSCGADLLKICEDFGVSVDRHGIIYDLIDGVKNIIIGMKDPIIP